MKIYSIITENNEIRTCTTLTAVHDITNTSVRTLQYRLKASNLFKIKAFTIGLSELELNERIVKRSKALWRKHHQ